MSNELAPTIADYSDESQNKHVAKKSLEHPLNLVAFALAVVAGVVGFLWASLGFLIWVAGGIALLGIANWAVQRFVRKDTIKHAYIMGLQALMVLEQKRIKASLRDDLMLCKRLPDSEEFALQGAGQFDSMEEKYRNVHDLLQAKLSEGEMAFGRFLGSAESVYKTSLDNLQQVVSFLKSAGSIDPDELNERLELIKAQEGGLDPESEAVQAINRQMELREEQMSKVHALLVKNEQALTLMEETSHQIASLKTGHRFSQADMGDAMAALEDIAARAKDFE